MSEKITVLESSIIRDVNNTFSRTRMCPPPVSVRVNRFEYATLQNPCIVTNRDSLFTGSPDVKELRGEYTTGTLPGAYREEDMFSFLSSDERSFYASVYPKDLVGVTADKGYFKGTFFETVHGKIEPVSEEWFSLYDPQIVVSDTHNYREKKNIYRSDDSSPLLVGWRTSMAPDEIVSMVDDELNTLLEYGSTRRN